MKRFNFKRGLSALVTSALIFTLAVPMFAAGGENLVVNGGFEGKILENKGVEGWTPYLGTATAIPEGVAYEILTDGAFEGKQYLKLSDDTDKGTANIISDKISVKAGDNITVSMKIKGYSGGMNSVIRFFSSEKAEAMDKDGRLTNPAIPIKDAAGSADWKEITLTTVAPAKTVKAYILIYGINASKGTVCVDDVKVSIGGGESKPTETPAPTVTPAPTDKPTEKNAESVLNSSITMYLDKSNAFVFGKTAPIDVADASVKPVTIDSRTVVPARFLAESFGAKVDWAEDTQTVTITAGSNVAKLVLNDTKMNLNGTDIILDVPAQTIGGRTVLPLRVICEQVLGKQVFWLDPGLIVVSDVKILDAEVEADKVIAEQIAKMF